MFMSIFNNKTISLSALLLITACSSAPKPALQPKSVAEVAPPVEESVVEVEAVDFNQQFYSEAVILLKSGKTEQALQLLIQVSNDAPEKPWVFTNLGLAYFKLQNSDLAEQAFKRAISRNNKDAVAQNHLGVLQRRKGQFDEARHRYQRAIEIDSAYASAYLNLGILFDIYLQDIDQALQKYQKYQSLVSNGDSQVAGWIVDIQRRLKTGTS